MIPQCVAGFMACLPAAENPHPARARNLCDLALMRLISAGLAGQG